MIIEGVYTALITPFMPNNRNIINYEMFKKLLHLQLDAGVDGILPLGTTGESPTLTQEEKDKIIKTTVDIAKNKAKILVGTGTNCTKQTIENTERAKDLGADAALVIAPYYNKPTQEGIYRHFAAVSEAVDLPIVVYNIKGRTGVNIETSTLAKMSQLHNIIAVKEASGDIVQMGEVARKLSSGSFSVMSGDDGLTLPAMALGVRGVISVVSNLIPKDMVELVKAANNNDFTSARLIHNRLAPIFKAAFIETNPIPIKAAMKLCGLNCGGYRLPLCEMKSENIEKLRQILIELNLLVNY